MKDGKPNRIRAAVKHNTMSMCILCFAVACFFCAFCQFAAQDFIEKMYGFLWAVGIK